MKLAVIGDTHLGRSLYNYDLTDHIRKTLYEFIAFCRRYEVTHAVHLGDVLDSSRPTLNVEKILIQICNEFERSGIDFHILVGNHEVVSKQIASALGIIRSVNYHHIYLHDTPSRVAVTPDLDLVFLPFPSPQYFTKNGFYIEYSRILKSSANQIVFSHLNVDGAELGDQQWIYRGGDFVLPEKYLQGKNTKLIVSGHIHSKQIIGKKHLILGASQRLRFSETLNSPAFALIKTAPVRAKLYPIKSAITLADIIVKVKRDCSVSTQSILNGLDVKNAIVKVQPEVEVGVRVDWREVTAEIYAKGAAQVFMLPPKRIGADNKVDRVVLKHREPLDLVKAYIEENTPNTPDYQEKRSLYLEKFKSIQTAIDSQ